MASRKYSDTREAFSTFNMDMAADVAKALDYGNEDLFADEFKEPKNTVEAAENNINIMEVVTEKATKEHAAQEKEKKTIKKSAETTKKKAPSKPKTETAAVKEDMQYLQHKRGRKKVYEEELIPIFGNFGADCLHKITEVRYKEKMQAATYMRDLIQREKEAYEKNPQSYVASRRKTAEVLFAKDKGMAKTYNFRINKELADFISDMTYEIRCTKELFIRIIVETDYQKKFK